MRNKSRKDCAYRHDNGNCLVVGGFCTAVPDKDCKTLEGKPDFKNVVEKIKKEKCMRTNPFANVTVEDWKCLDWILEGVEKRTIYKSDLLENETFVQMMEVIKYNPEALDHIPRCILDSAIVLKYLLSANPLVVYFHGFKSFSATFPEEEKLVAYNKVKNMITENASITNDWIPCYVKDHPDHDQACEVTIQDPEGVRREVAFYADKWRREADEQAVNVIAWKEPSKPYQPEKETKNEENLNY